MFYCFTPGLLCTLFNMWRDFSWIVWNGRFDPYWLPFRMDFYISSCSRGFYPRIMVGYLQYSTSIHCHQYVYLLGDLDPWPLSLVVLAPCCTSSAIGCICAVLTNYLFSRWTTNESQGIMECWRMQTESSGLNLYVCSTVEAHQLVTWDLTTDIVS